MNEIILDQIPNLGALQRFLEQLAISEPPAYKPELIIEQVAEIYDNLISKNKGKWKDLAKKQANTVLDPNDKDIIEQAKRWADAFNTEAIESLIDEPAKCAECGQPGPKQCSRCKSEWYCRRECQVKHWPKHKKICDLVHETNLKAANAAKN